MLASKQKPKYLANLEQQCLPGTSIMACPSLQRSKKKYFKKKRKTTSDSRIFRVAPSNKFPLLILKRRITHLYWHLPLDQTILVPLDPE
jgi:hypothetical protein